MADRGLSASRDVASQVREVIATLSPSERKVARALLADYPVAGLETVAALAGSAGVSPPTVVRFVARLGFSGHAEFQKALMREVHESLGSPLRQYESTATPRPDDFLAHMSQAFGAQVRDSFEATAQHEFETAVDLVCDDRKRILLVGGRFSGVLSDYLHLHLELLRKNVSRIPHDPTSRLATVVTSSRADVLVVFDYRRYDPETVRLAEAMAQRGATVVLFTDTWMSPISHVASVVLPVRVEASSPFDSLTAAMAMVESLVAAVAERYGEKGRQRVEAIEHLRDGLRGTTTI
jgi:DNA-binding MurR/RpiR family transcriptional regulator